ncbi:hypothetical protein D0T50_11425 [Bacteroides sp. 214]|uniref:tetratricopeptide repeat-containing sensor histidine kinase n=1 Tax=Bacteroides sp. 214 TaxID=2302935 RepID=UPI0013D3BFA1|nr:ATP-binding protein [Bacteroides sp. 214]NDW13499.1 hypothetical protein [Bacteroides sp. 214]
MSTLGYRFRFVYLFLLVFLLHSFACNAWAQKTPQQEREDSILNIYNKKCVELVADPIVLSVSDTFFNLAKQYNRIHEQSVALVAKLDHYYYGSNPHKTDSIIAWVNRVKRHAKETHDQNAYYFVWGQRLINHYIGRGEYHIALFEAEKMMKEAEAEEYMEGIANCYSCMANIYTAKGITTKGVEFLQKEIDLFESHEGLKRFNISLHYSDAAKYYIELGQKEKAPALLKRATEQAQTNYHRVTAKMAYILLYLADNDIALASKTLKECEELFENDLRLQRHKSYLYEVEMTYYRHIKEYDKALAALQQRVDLIKGKSETSTLTRMARPQADIYWEMGQKEKAAELYRTYLDVLDQDKIHNEEITTAEYATLLDIQKINAEKKELEMLSQERELQNVRIIVFFLVTLLALIIFFLYKQRKLNRQLKKSKDELLEKNIILEAAEKELRIAKDIAEESSRMKTIFIQNMSHEIRTPLNSIVGFSAVLAGMFAEEDEDVQSFAKLIEDNSQLLLKLISDILEISALDGSEQGFPLSPVDINTCCEECVKAVKSATKEGVSVVFKSNYQSLTTESNLEKLSLALTNILSNAVKFTEQGEVVLSCEVEKNKILLSITDTGVGIPAEKQEQIFERFVKLNEFVQGTGLGLPISRIIAEKLGGSLILDKNYTNGSRFVLSIPLK